MKLGIVLLILSLAGLSLALSPPAPPPRGCIYALGRCIRECPEGTHAYSTGCSQKMPEPTCDEPNPVKETAIICDYSACYCNAPTVRDKVSGKCVALEDCPEKEVDCYDDEE